MRKSDLKNGMIVELRNGDMCIVLDDKLLDTNDFTYIDIYDDNLTDDCQKELDIVRVYKDKSMSSLEDRYTKNKLTLIWERKEVDWSKVEFGARVRVWDKADRKFEGVFLEYKPQNTTYPFRVYIKEEEHQEYIYWKNCEII